MSRPVHLQANAAQQREFNDFATFQGKGTRSLEAWFLGPRGDEIAERLVGAGVPDFYGAYFDQRLVTARKALSRRP